MNKQSVRFLVTRKIFITRIVVTLLSIVFIRSTIFIPIPGIEQNYLYLELKNSQILNFLSGFSQGSFFLLGPFTLGILPNINAAIIIQFLIAVIPPLKRLQEQEGEIGRQKILRITRYLTFIIAFQYGLLIAFYLKPFLFGWTILKAIQIAIILATGALITLWISEIISEYGVGNGPSLLILVNISSSLPMVWQIFKSLDTIFLQLFFVILFIIGIGGILIVQSARRQIPLVSVTSFYKNSIVTEKNLPLRLNPSGIMPLIFASTALNGVSTLINQFSSNLIQNQSFNTIYLGVYFLAIMYFSYYATQLAIKPTDISNYLKRLSYTIKQVPPGFATIQFLRETLNRLAALGGFLLASSVYIPSLLVYLSPILSSLKGLSVTSLFILVGVAIDLATEIQTFKIVESYEDKQVI